MDLAPAWNFTRHTIVACLALEEPPTGQPALDMDNAQLVAADLADAHATTGTSEKRATENALEEPSIPARATEFAPVALLELGFALASRALDSGTVRNAIAVPLGIGDQHVMESAQAAAREATAAMD